MFSEKQMAYKLELDKKENLRTQLSDSLGRREALATHLVSIQSYQAEQEFIDGTKLRMIQADQAILRAGRDMEKYQQFYIFSRKQTRMIEVLFEKAEAQHKKSVMKRENRDLDDLMIMRSRLEPEYKVGGK